MELFWGFIVFALGLCAFMYGGLFNDPTAMMIGLAGIGTAMATYNVSHTYSHIQVRYKNCMQRTAEMEIECYGMIVSSSVEWWLEDNGLIKKTPPGGPGCASFRKVPPPPPTGLDSWFDKPPAPSRNHCSGCRHCSAAAKAGLCCCECERAWYQDPCVRECPMDNLFADGQIIAVYCTRHGRRAPWPLPPARPNPGIATRR